MNVDAVGFLSLNDCARFSSGASLLKDGDGDHHPICGFLLACKTEPQLADFSSG
jgi:hypothetical protein